MRQQGGGSRGLRQHILPAVMLPLLLTLTGCPPDPVHLRTRAIDLPCPVRIEPVIVEHMKDHSTYNHQFGEYWHRLTATHYTLKTTDGMEMDVFVGDHPYVVIRNPANGERTCLGWWGGWSEPTQSWPPPPAPEASPTVPTTPGATP